MFDPGVNSSSLTFNEARALVLDGIRSNLVRAIPFYHPYTFDQRVALAKVRLDAARRLEGAAKGLEAKRSCLNRWLSSLEKLSDRAAGIVRRSIDFIASPDIRTLEENGKVARHLIRNGTLGRQSAVLSNRIFQVQRALVSVERENFDELIEYFDEIRSPSEIGSVASSSDELNLRLIEEREQLRGKLTRTAQLTFGEALISSSNTRNIVAGRLLPQRMIDGLCFSAAVDQNLHGRDACVEWQSVEQLEKLRDSDLQSFNLINEFLLDASLREGREFHPVHYEHEGQIRSLLGLDNANFWSIRGLNRRDTLARSDDIALEVKVRSVPVLVSLFDDTHIRSVADIVRYANGLISLSQFQELVLDYATFSKSRGVGCLIPNPPENNPWMLDYLNPRVQTRGAICLTKCAS